MAMINIVDSKQMRNAANEIEQMVHDYTQQVAALYQDGQDLDAFWKGDAKKTFDSRLGSDQPRFEALSNVVKQYIETLRKAATEYDNNEARAVEILG